MGRRYEYSAESVRSALEAQAPSAIDRAIGQPSHGSDQVDAQSEVNALLAASNAILNGFISRKAYACMIEAMGARKRPSLRKTRVQFSAEEIEELSHNYYTNDAQHISDVALINDALQHGPLHQAFAQSSSKSQSKKRTVHFSELEETTDFHINDAPRMLSCSKYTAEHAVLPDMTRSKSPPDCQACPADEHEQPPVEEAENEISYGDTLEEEQELERSIARLQRECQQLRDHNCKSGSTS